MFMQGDVVDNVPRILIPPTHHVPEGGTEKVPVSGEASYCRTRAMIVSPTCNIRPGDDNLIQVATVTPWPDMPKGMREELTRGRRHRQFLLREHDE